MLCILLNLQSKDTIPFQKINWESFRGGSEKNGHHFGVWIISGAVKVLDR